MACIYFIPLDSIYSFFFTHPNKEPCSEKPNALGTMIGALLVSTLENGLTICAVPFYVLPAVKGAVLALALVAAYATKKEQ